MTSSHSKIIYPNSASVHSTESIVFTDSAIELATWNFFFFKKNTSGLNKKVKKQKSPKDRKVNSTN